MREFSGLLCGLLLIAALGVSALYQAHEHSATMADGQTIHHVAQLHEHQNHHS